MVRKRSVWKKISIFNNIREKVGLKHFNDPKAFVEYSNDMQDVYKNITKIFHQLESIQYNACLAITGAIRGISKEKRYQELGLESLQLWRWYRKLGKFLQNLQKQKSSISF